jgi:hypothetical protein
MGVIHIRVKLKTIKLTMRCSVKHAALRSKNKDCVEQSQYNVSE